ncbi:nicotinate (nicotinamide) nucleotide adenylyltransferase [Pelagibacteraceae bacterium]|jgi:nicotinate-nucleotide adenylyltransferase|nr:nicotinate (nicotinamide) nucleotide adenylyltransferase [Pelagibacteraceae bacterium]MDC0530273.1 nicotinate (nicotinamide) nucleotide adenylyltransferase [Pelagibacteraceae bacterium]MDC0952333.1 nicotinate (nicotinamide) nucleotide adenylyltransferase [Pelagibacteraceae bacterium]
MVKFSNKSIGLLGGSFDPVHRGHIAISKIAIKKIKLRKIFWLITKKNPFKDKVYFSLKDRIKLAKKAIKNSNKIQVLYLDQTVKSSRSIDLVNYFIKKRGINNIYFIIGSDILLELHKWKSWKKLIKLTKLIVFSRKGYDKKSKNSIVAKYLKNKNIIYIKIKPIVTSSTLIRNKLIKKS